MRVLHFCPDDSASSGVNCFCTELSSALNVLGVRSGIVRNFSTLNSQPSTLLLHLHGLWLREHHRAAVWARRHHVPVVWSTHGMTAPWSMRHKRWKKLLAWWLYQKRDLKRASLIHCTTEQEAEWNRGLGLGRTCVVPLGCRQVEEPRITRISRIEELTGEEREEQSEVEERKFRFLFVGRIHPVKGLMNLVRAMGILNLRPSCPHLVIVGPDEVGYEAELRRECVKLGVDKDVSFVGEKHGAELEREYESCDVLVLPSFTENFGGVVVDAMAHGKPVIASRATPWKVLENGMGWWVGNDPETLAETLRKVGEMPREELRAMGERGRKFVAENYTWDVVAKRMNAEYLNIGMRKFT